MIGVAAVIADAAMVDSVIGLDVRRDDERAVPGARMGMLVITRAKLGMVG